MSNLQVAEDKVEYLYKQKKMNMEPQKLKSANQITIFLEKIILGQSEFELHLNKTDRKQNGVFLTNSLSTVENVLSIVEINFEIFNKRILEPSCGQGIFVLKLITNIYNQFPDEKLITGFISNNLFFVDIQKEMVQKTIFNIQTLYLYLFEDNYTGTLMQ